MSTTKKYNYRKELKSRAWNSATMILGRRWRIIHPRSSHFGDGVNNVNSLSRSSFLTKQLTKWLPAEEPVQQVEETVIGLEWFSCFLKFTLLDEKKHQHHRQKPLMCADHFFWGCLFVEKSLPLMRPFWHRCNRPGAKTDGVDSMDVEEVLISAISLHWSRLETDWSCASEMNNLQICRDGFCHRSFLVVQIDVMPLLFFLRRATGIKAGPWGKAGARSQGRPGA